DVRPDESGAACDEEVPACDLHGGLRRALARQPARPSREASRRGLRQGAILDRMCGIAGTAGGAGPSRALLERMAETMVKRGPDGQGLWYDETAGIACRRLAIIDLHERSDQPLHFGSLHIVFNGEIYNY